MKKQYVVSDLANTSLSAIYAYMYDLHANIYIFFKTWTS